MLDQDRSDPITALYPTQYEWLRRCPLHVAFGRQSKGSGGHRRRSDAQRLGDAIHEVMRAVVADRTLVQDDWRGRVAEEWAQAVASEEAKDSEDPGASSRWANFEEKRQRTLRLAERVRELMLAHGADAFLPEQHLSGRGGVLKGIADLIVRAEGMHAVIDYKTGSVASDDGASIKVDYERQLRLYACLEREASGSWPDQLAIYPLKGEAVLLDVSPEACEQAAEDAFQALADYNAAAPGPQDARPGPDACPRCEFATGCEALWASAPVEGVAMASGLVAEVFLAERGSTSLVIDQQNGRRIELLTISPAIHAEVTLVRPGDTVRVVSLEETDEPGFYRLPPSGRLGVVATAEEVPS